MLKIVDSYEVERLRKLIIHKKECLNKIDPIRNKVAFRLIQGEIILLENEILPIVLNSSVIHHSEFSKHAVRCFDEAVNFKCNGVLFYYPIHGDYEAKPIVGIVNPVGLKGFGVEQSMSVSIDNMDGHGVGVEVVNLILPSGVL